MDIFAPALAAHHLGGQVPVQMRMAVDVGALACTPAGRTRSTFTPVIEFRRRRGFSATRYMLNHSEIRDGASQDPTPFQVWCDNSEFWSDFGYDGLSLVFGVPLDTFRGLPEAQKMALFRLMVYLADRPDDPLQAQVQALATPSADLRLAALLDLSARLG